MKKQELDASLLPQSVETASLITMKNVTTAITRLMTVVLQHVKKKTLLKRYLFVEMVF